MATKTVEDLEHEVDALRETLMDLQHALAGEVRTRRLVITDAKDRERIIAGDCGHTSEDVKLEVFSPRGSSSIYLYGNRECDDEVGLVVNVGGNTAAHLAGCSSEEHPGREASLSFSDARLGMPSRPFVNIDTAGVQHGEFYPALEPMYAPAASNGERRGRSSRDSSKSSSH